MWGRRSEESGRKGRRKKLHRTRRPLYLRMISFFHLLKVSVLKASSACFILPSSGRTKMAVMLFW